MRPKKPSFPAPGEGAEAKGFLTVQLQLPGLILPVPRGRAGAAAKPRRLSKHRRLLSKQASESGGAICHLIAATPPPD